MQSPIKYFTELTDPRIDRSKEHSKHPPYRSLLASRRDAERGYDIPTERRIPDGMPCLP
jgi:hypothetical protein